jgi:hypothetical protein
MSTSTLLVSEGIELGLFGLKTAVFGPMPLNTCSAILLRSTISLLARQMMLIPSKFTRETSPHGRHEMIVGLGESPSQIPYNKLVRVSDDTHTSQLLSGIMRRKS